MSGRSSKAIARSYRVVGQGRALLTQRSGPFRLPDSRFVRKCLVVVAAGALQSACGGELVTTPPAARFEPVELPVPPEGEADCDGSPCLSDRQFGTLFDSVVNALELANAKLEWLRDYYQPE